MAQDSHWFVDSTRDLLPEAWRSGWAAPLLIALFTTVLFWIVWKLIRLLARRLEARMGKLKGIRIRALRLQRQDLLTEEQGANVLATLVRWLSYVALAILFYFYLNAVFSLFPATRGLAGQLLGYAFAALVGVGAAILGYLPKLATLIFILFAAKWIIYFVRLVFDGLKARRIRLSGFYPEWAAPTYGLVRILLIALTVVVAFPYLPGSGSQAFQGISIFLGILFSLASTGVVAHIISGMALTYTRAFRVGDVVEIADAFGVVQEKTALVTRIRTTKNQDVSIPNAMVLGNQIINYTSQASTSGVILHTTVTIGYDVPWPTVHEALLEAAGKTDGLESEPEPFVRQTSLDDFYAAYEINAYTRSPEEASRIYSDLHQNLQDSLHAAGIEIASPHLSAVRDGNAINVPGEHLPGGYEPGAFRLRSLLFPGDKK
jgi:small-conductance mechanosensitive channel